MEELILSGLSRRRKAISVPWEKKLFWISKNLGLFEMVDATYEHPKANYWAKMLANQIREKFDYSYKTIDCDLVWTWLNVYREHKLKLENKETMSDTFDHAKLTDRIKSVFSNKAYEDQWDMLMEIFPEIYEQMANDRWNQQYILGHVYMRREQTSGRVVSLLMPVLVTFLHESHGNVVKLLNLITGTFWEPTITLDKDQKVISPQQWQILTHKMSGENFIHLGEFGHSIHNTFIQGEHEPFSLHAEDIE